MSDDTYANPVYNEYMADPFVLTFNGEYYAYGTSGRGWMTFPVLHSTDLVHWRNLGMALQPLAGAFASYWAPEVAYDNGTFYMYYSAGGPEGEGHQLRVATAQHPAGPFQDSGRVLTPDDPFTIDAHPFRDEDGTWYLFYCHDFLDGERVGTGILVDRMVDMLTLAGEPRTVVRPHADWNVYQRQRAWYGRVWDWYTIEGASVRKRENRYYCFYSGGAWREPNYGVSYVVADHPLGPYQIESGTEAPDILTTVPGEVIGPGHISVVAAPDNVHEYIVYHAWDVNHTGRLMRIDPLTWNATRPSCDGPSFQPAPTPPMPHFRDLFDQPDGTPARPEAWQIVRGDWRVQHSELHQTDCAAPDAAALIQAVALAPSFVFEVNLRFMDTASTDSAAGVFIHYDHEDRYVIVELLPGQNSLALRHQAAGQNLELQTVSLAPLGRCFRADAYHHLRVERQGDHVRLFVDRVLLMSQSNIAATGGAAGIWTRNVAAAFDGIALTFVGQE